MIDPKNITNFNRSDAELQAFWLFCIFVAGRNSDFAADAVGRFLNVARKKKVAPFFYLHKLGETGVHNSLVAHRVGQYTRIARAIKESLRLDGIVGLRHATVDQLMGVFGVGPKTARFFVLHSREGAEVAVLDTHILKWLKNRLIPNVPDSTPQSPEKYKRLEDAWLARIRHHFPLLTPAQADLMIWLDQSGRLDNDGLAPKLP